MRSSLAGGTAAVLERPAIRQDGNVGADSLTDWSDVRGPMIVRRSCKAIFAHVHDNGRKARQPGDVRRQPGNTVEFPNQQPRQQHAWNIEIAVAEIQVVAGPRVRPAPVYGGE